MARLDRAVSVYLFDIDDNLLILPTHLYLWNAETGQERMVSSSEFARIQGELGRPGQWHAWASREETFRDFRDKANTPPEEQVFVRDIVKAIETGDAWRGPSWPLLTHAARAQRPTAFVTARGHTPATIQAGLTALAHRKLLPGLPPILGTYCVSNPDVRADLGASDPAMTIPSVKKLAIRRVVSRALEVYGVEHAHRFGMSDDDPQNVMLAISAMRECKLEHPDKRFFVINTNQGDLVKLEIFPIDCPVTSTAALLRDAS